MNVGPIGAALACGSGASVKGRCCEKMDLEHVQWPVYQCRSCGKKVKLVKKTIIQVKVIS